MIRAVWKCLGYTFRHKYHVYVAARKLGVGRWQAFMHDMSKFTWIELSAYARNFYSDKKDNYSFDLAWLHHIHRNPHHWQYWILRTDSEGVRTLRMPEKYVREMVADWIGVGLALGKGPDNAKKWYAENRSVIALHPQTRNRVEVLLGVTPGDAYSKVVPQPGVLNHV